MYYILGDSFKIHTTNEYRYNYTWITPRHSYFKFKAMTCNDAHVLLSSESGRVGDKVTEIVLGGARDTW